MHSLQTYVKKMKGLDTEKWERIEAHNRLTCKYGMTLISNMPKLHRGVSTQPSAIRTSRLHDISIFGYNLILLSRQTDKCFHATCSIACTDLISKQAFDKQK